jgi:hypothetical protein
VVRIEHPEHRVEAAGTAGTAAAGAGAIAGGGGLRAEGLGDDEGGEEQESGGEFHESWVPSPAAARRKAGEETVAMGNGSHETTEVFGVDVAAAENC